MTTYLRRHEQASDLIASADTLVYFGELGEVTAAAARTLRPGGVLVFTVERALPDDAPSGYRINPHGRYSHTADYLSRTLAQAGFLEPTIREVQLRKEANQWVEGWLVSARKRAVSCHEVIREVGFPMAPIGQSHLLAEPISCCPSGKNER